MDELIRRSDAIKAVREYAGRYTFNAYHNGMLKAASIIASIPSADRPQEWIPCSERLPSEEKATYLVCTDSEYMCSCRWTNTNPIWTDLTTEWHWCIFDIPQYSKVVAWMPLKPWKGADDE